MFEAEQNIIMKQIQKDELYENLKQFLDKKGIVLRDGSYANTIQKSCRILADVINLGQQGVEKVKTGVDHKLEQVRQAIHSKTSAKRGNGGAAKSDVPPPITPEPKTARKASKESGAGTPPVMEPEATEAPKPARKGKAKKPAAPKRSRKAT